MPVVNPQGHASETSDEAQRGFINFSLLAPSTAQLVQIPSALPPMLAVLVDAEEDFDWTKPFSNGSASVASMRHQHRAQSIFARFGVVPTYVVDYPVAAQPDGYSPLREFLTDGACEVGAQLHPWVNPPHGEAVSVYNSFPGNLPREMEAAKLNCLTEAIQENLGVRPIVYKAGRYGIGPNTSSILEEAGYRIDSSVAARRSFAAEQGADFSLIGPVPYWFGTDGGMLELPLTCDYTGAARATGPSWYPRINSPLGRFLRVPGILARLRLLDRVHLTPEGVTLTEAKRLTRVLLQSGHRLFVLAYHSPSLVPGNTPYVRNHAELTRFLAWLDGYLEFFCVEIGGKPASPRRMLEIVTAMRKQR
jgi:hypothetical protein